MLTDNVPAVNVFVSMGTQWRFGPSGAIGLDYAALPAVLRLTGTPRKRHRAVFEDLRVMEIAALDALRRK